MFNTEPYYRDHTRGFPLERILQQRLPVDAFSRITFVDSEITQVGNKVYELEVIETNSQDELMHGIYHTLTSFPDMKLILRRAFTTETQNYITGRGVYKFRAKYIGSIGTDVSTDVVPAKQSQPKSEESEYKITIPVSKFIPLSTEF